MKMEIQHTKIIRCSKSSTKKEVTVINDYTKGNKRSLNNLTLHLKKLEKWELAQSEQKEGDDKDQSRNKIETLQTLEKKINDTELFKKNKQNWQTLARLTEKKQRLK